MTLLAFHTFNEPNTGIVRDYSTLGNDSISVTLLSVVSGDIGSAGRFNGSTTEVEFGDIIDVGGSDNISIFLKVRPLVSKLHALAWKEDQWEVGITAGNKAYFKFIIGSSTKELVSTGTITIAGDYVTIGFTYDGALGSANAKIYIDGVVDSTTLNQTGNLDASSRNVKLGTNNVDFYNGNIEMFSAYSQTLNQAEITSVDDKSGGFVVDFKDTSDFSIGDLLLLSDKGATAGAECVVTGDLGSNQLLILPISNDIPQGGDIIKTVGNVFDTDRQWLLQNVIDSDTGLWQLKDRVDNFTKADIVNEGTKGFRYTKDALKWKAAICPDFTIRPPEQVGSIDDFNPTDIEFANALYISSTTPTSWTGLQAPSPVKPQLIFIINSGTKNITIRNNDGASVAANRFSLNTNVILSPNDCGFLLYDEVTSRWRVNKI